MKIEIESGQVVRLPNGSTTHPDGGTYDVGDLPEKAASDLLKKKGVTEVKPEKRKKTTTTSSD